MFCSSTASITAIRTAGKINEIRSRNMTAACCRKNVNRSARALHGSRHRPGETVGGVDSPSFPRRELVLRGFSFPFILGSLLNAGFAEPPAGSLGVKEGRLGLCPSGPGPGNCISTAEEFANEQRYVPPWTWAPQDSPGRRDVTQEQAIEELVGVLEGSKPQGFIPRVVTRKINYVRCEFTSPVFGYVDDVEFYFPPGEVKRVEYRSASRVGNDDGGVNRKRIRELRIALESLGWRSVGF